MKDTLLRSLTAKEKKVLEFIETYLQEQGIAPSYQEIKEHFGFASFNSVQRYLQQLQNKNYIFIPGGNQKRAISVLRSSSEIQSSLSSVGGHRLNNPTNSPTLLSQPPPRPTSAAEVLSLPLLGRVAAGQPIERVAHDEYVQVSAAMVRYPDKTYALRVEGDSMIEDGILDGDVIFVQQQDSARNGETIVAMVNHQATVKRFYLHNQNKENVFVHSNPQSAAQVELRPANSTMTSFWYRPDQVNVQGVVVGLLRQY